MSYSRLRTGRYFEPGREYFITTVVHGRQAVFREFDLARHLIKELSTLEARFSVVVLAWVVMPNHFHALIQLNGDTKLATLMRNFKGRAASRLNRKMQRRGAFWQPGFYDHALRKEETEKRWQDISWPIH